ncbi:MAG: AAA family ATPase [Myxococcales bacterium]|nr:AAA family ATPase [Myxococcales bacterium]
MNDEHDLALLLASRVALVVVESVEEPRVVALFRRLVEPTRRPLFRWSLTDGLRPVAEAAAVAGARVTTRYTTPPPDGRSDPAEALRDIRGRAPGGVWLMLDLHPFLDDPLVVRLIKEIALDHDEGGHTLVLVSHALTLPPEIRPYAARFAVSLPDPAGIEQIVREEARAWGARHGRKVNADRRALSMLVSNLTGLTAADARRLARGAINDDGAITEADLPAVMSAKHRLLDDGSAISFELDTARFEQIGGLVALKAWLARRRPAFFGEAPELDAPRGVLLVGVQGGGKSLAAKAVAGAWGLPLLRLDVGALYDKYFGETEKNLRDALRTAELMAPCVLWVDEVEKALAEGGNDAGTSRRLLGHLLTWMAERTAQVFIVATANDIEALPAELIRKGRLDEIFFVDLPEAEVRAEIFAIHLRRRAFDPEGFDGAALAEASEGFSGAEIEQAIVSACYVAREREAPLDTAHLLEELARTRPLSVVMAEKVARLRAWAAERTVPAN